MKRVYRMAAAFLVALAGFAVIEAGFLLVATATVIGVLVMLAARLAISGQPGRNADWATTGNEEDRIGT